MKEHATVPGIPHFVSGGRASGRSGRPAPVFNPATGEQSGTVSLASREEVNAAVAAAKALGGETYLSNSRPAGGSA